MINKKIYKFLVFLLILIIPIILITGCDNKKEENVLKEKIDQEINYLNDQLLKSLNELNDISFVGYRVLVEQIEESNNDVQTSSVNSDDSNEELQSEETGEVLEGSSGKPNISNMYPSNILNRNPDSIDWTLIKESVETIYSSWSVIISDLYKVGANSNDILSFSAELDQAILNVNKEDKNASLESLAKLYSYLPIYLNSYSNDDMKKNIQNIKANIINGYSLVEQDRWDEITVFITDASKYFSIIVNNTSINDQNQGRIAKVYTLVKELENSLSLKDKDIFYIKYKVLMIELDTLI